MLQITIRDLYSCLHKTSLVFWKDDIGVMPCSSSCSGHTVRACEKLQLTRARMPNTQKGFISKSECCCRFLTTVSCLNVSPWECYQLQQYYRSHTTISSCLLLWEGKNHALICLALWPKSCALFTNSERLIVLFGRPMKALMQSTGRAMRPTPAKTMKRSHPAKTVSPHLPVAACICSICFICYSLFACDFGLQPLEGPQSRIFLHG